MKVEFKLQRVSLVLRLICGLFGLAGLLLAWLLLSDAAALAKQPGAVVFEIVVGIAGLFIFLFVAIIGVFPNVAPDEKHGESK